MGFASVVDVVNMSCLLAHYPIRSRIVRKRSITCSQEIVSSAEFFHSYSSSMTILLSAPSLRTRIGKGIRGPGSSNRNIRASSYGDIHEGSDLSW
jgi:hypothetical protein